MLKTVKTGNFKPLPI